MEADRLKILPGSRLFLLGEELRHPRHEKQHIRLLDNLVPLQPVEADAVVAGTVIRFELGNIHRLQ